MSEISEVKKKSIILIMRLLVIFIILTQTQIFSCKIYEIFKSTYFEEHLPTTAYVLHSHDSLLSIRFTLYLIHSSLSSLLLLLITEMFVFDSNLKGFKELKSSISFHWSQFNGCYFLFPYFFCLSQFCFIFSCRC